MVIIILIAMSKAEYSRDNGYVGYDTNLSAIPQVLLKYFIFSSVRYRPSRQLQLFLQWNSNHSGIDQTLVPEVLSD